MTKDIKSHIDINPISALKEIDKQLDLKISGYKSSQRVGRENRTHISFQTKRKGVTSAENDPTPLSIDSIDLYNVVSENKGIINIAGSQYDDYKNNGFIFPKTDYNKIIKPLITELAKTKWRRFDFTISDLEINDPHIKDNFLSVSVLAYKYDILSNR